MAEVEAMTKEDLKHAISTLSFQFADFVIRCQKHSVELEIVQEQLKMVQEQLKMVQEQLKPSTDAKPSLFSECNIMSSYHEILCSGTLFAYSKKLQLHLLVECANHKIQNHCEFSEKGQCAMAADYAHKWISTCYPLMNPQIIRDAIMIRPYGEEPIAFNDGTRNSAAQTRAVVPGMKVAMWNGKHKPLSSNWTKKYDPIWECLTFNHTTTRTGVLHTVLLVTTEEGHRQCLDLSIGQFREEELPGVMLYYNEGDSADELEKP